VVGADLGSLPDVSTELACAASENLVEGFVLEVEVSQQGVECHRVELTVAWTLLALQTKTKYENCASYA